VFDLELSRVWIDRRERLLGPRVQPASCPCVREGSRRQPGSFMPGNARDGGPSRRSEGRGRELSPPVEVFRDLLDHVRIFDAASFPISLNVSEEHREHRAKILSSSLHRACCLRSHRILKSERAKCKEKTQVADPSGDNTLKSKPAIFDGRLPNGFVVGCDHRVFRRRQHRYRNGRAMCRFQTRRNRPSVSVRPAAHGPCGDGLGTG
jgi:hypothetical protein